MTEQLQTVIDAAERAAEAIRYDAEEQARRHLAEAQRKADRLTAERVGLISELTDDLVRHAANVRDHSEQMVRALEDAINSVTDKLEQPAMTDPFPGSEPPGPSLPFGEPLDGAHRLARSAGDTGRYTDLAGMPPPTWSAGDRPRAARTSPGRSRLPAQRSPADRSRRPTRPLHRRAPGARPPFTGSAAPRDPPRDRRRGPERDRARLAQSVRDRRPGPDRRPGARQPSPR